MAESAFWGHLSAAFEREAIPGRVRRVEEKGRSGFVDTLMCYRGVTHFLELKHVAVAWNEVNFSREEPYGLKGSQALELDSWAKAGAPSALIVGFGGFSRARAAAGSAIAVWHGAKALDLFREDGRSNPLPPDRVYYGTFCWGTYLHHFG